MQKLIWITEKRKVNDLVPYEKNPRKMSAETMKRLQDSLDKFGLVEIPAINYDNILIAGHQRCKALKMLGKGEELIGVRVPDRQLTDTELREYNIVSNAIDGDWVEEILKESFSDIDLLSLGLDIDLSEYEKTGIVEAEPEQAVYPIVQKFTEKHTAFIIACDNELDENFIKQVLGLQSEKSYKNNNVATSHVISAQKFILEWNKLK
jgi:hypothetical protein